MKHLDIFYDKHNPQQTDKILQKHNAIYCKQNELCKSLKLRYS